MATQALPETEIAETAAGAADEYGASQIILFGSAARGEAGPDSDIDLLVVLPDEGGGEPDPRNTTHERLEPGTTLGGRTVNRQTDLIIGRRADIEAGRNSTTAIQGEAIEHGRTLFVDAGFRSIRTGPDYALIGGVMVKKSTFEPEVAEEFATDAKYFVNLAETAEPDESKFACMHLQHALEKALKGVIAAAGTRVAHTHNLNRLWDDAIRSTGPIPGRPSHEALERLSKYRGELGYGKSAGGPKPSETRAETQKGVRSAVDHAAKEIPELCRRTAERNARMAAEDSLAD